MSRRRRRCSPCAAVAAAAVAVAAIALDVQGLGTPLAVSAPARQPVAQLEIRTSSLKSAS
eukprot:2958163-Pleurochrysis_carterae.AAC.1